MDKEPVKEIKLEESVDSKDAEPIKDEDLSIALTIRENLYIAKESDGYIKPLPGFFIKTKNGFIVSELTIVRGKKTVKDEKGNFIKDDKGNLIYKPAVFGIMFYNNNGERGYCSIEDSISFNGKSISFRKMKVKFEEIPHTLMSLDTTKQFLKGETIEIEAVYPVLKAKQKKFVSCHWDERLYDLIACISIATYFFDVFGVFPITWFFGAFETGKGRGIKCVVYASRKGVYWEDVTKASVLRIAELLQPTLGIDEYQDVEPILRAYLRGSYKEGVKSPRVEQSKDGFILRAFGKFHPAVIGSTETIERGSFIRTIPVKMKKMRKEDPIEDRDPTEYDFDDIRDDLYICRLTQANKVYETFQTLRKEELGFYGREWEIWRAPLTIAKIISEEVFNNVLSLAKEICSSKREEMYTEEKDILHAIYLLFKQQNSPMRLTFFPKEVTIKIWEQKSKEFTADNWENDVEFKRKYSPICVGFILKRIGLEPKYVSKGTRYTITAEEFNRLVLDFGLQVEK